MDLAAAVNFFFFFWWGNEFFQYKQNPVSNVNLLHMKQGHKDLNF